MRLAVMLLLVVILCVCVCVVQCVCSEGRVLEFPVIKIAEKDIVDTNGAGDAFVGGE